MSDNFKVFDLYKIQDPLAFFNDRTDYKFCKREWTHICPSDSNPDLSPRLTSIFINDKDYEAILKDL